MFLVITLYGQQMATTITFEQTFPGSDPAHYIVSVASDCAATYQSDGKLTDQAAAEESFRFDFKVTPANCGRVLELTKRAHFFEGAVDSKKKNIAITGIKVLSYRDGQKNNKVTYNYSPLPEVQELTAFFQSLGGVMEFGRRLDYDHHYQKLALDEELKKMEESAGRNDLQEISAISPTLEGIIHDPSLMNVVRARAQRLLAGAR
jgi:hypothetical protein